jgi:hypothetical protein
LPGAFLPAISCGSALLRAEPALVLQAGATNAEPDQFLQLVLERNESLQLGCSSSRSAGSWGAEKGRSSLSWWDRDRVETNGRTRPSNGAAPGRFFEKNDIYNAA